jgi:aconitate hydratase
MLVPPLPITEAQAAALEKTPNIASIPELDAVPDEMALTVVLKTGDDVSTDDIVPAGTRVMPFWSNIPRLGEFVYEQVDAGYTERAIATRNAGGHAIVGGNNYGQGSSRENAALAPRYLGLRVAVARSFARIHWQNMVNFGVLPLTFADPSDYDRIAQGDVLHFSGLHAALRAGHVVTGRVGDRTIALRHDLSPRQLEVLLAGGVINWLRQRVAA